MYEGEFKHEREESIESAVEGVQELLQELEAISGEPVPCEVVDGTFEIDTNAFSLTFTLNKDRFAIRNIDVHGNAGLGHRIVDAIHTFADERGLEVAARNVRSEARGFWETMGYQEGDEEGEYYRVV